MWNLSIYIKCLILKPPYKRKVNFVRLKSFPENRKNKTPNFIIIKKISNSNGDEYKGKLCKSKLVYYSIGFTKST